MATFEVIVGNIGKVYDGDDFNVADRTFDEYVDKSNMKYGRAASEEVILMKNGEVEFHYEGMTCSCSECGLNIPRDEALLVTADDGLNLTFCTERCKTKMMRVLYPSD